MTVTINLDSVRAEFESRTRRRAPVLRLLAAVAFALGGLLLVPPPAAEPQPPRPFAEVRALPLDGLPPAEAVYILYLHRHLDHLRRESARALQAPTGPEQEPPAPKPLPAIPSIWNAAAIGPWVQEVRDALAAQADEHPAVTGVQEMELELDRVRRGEPRPHLRPAISRVGPCAETPVPLQAAYACAQAATQDDRDIHEAENIAYDALFLAHQLQVLATNEWSIPPLKAPRDAVERNDVALFDAEQARWSSWRSRELVRLEAVREYARHRHAAALLIAIAAGLLLTAQRYARTIVVESSPTGLCIDDEVVPMGTIAGVRLEVCRLVVHRHDTSILISREFADANFQDAVQLVRALQHIVTTRETYKAEQEHRREVEAERTSHSSKRARRGRTT